ncbi:MAG: hypothetical protein RR826_06630 [Christensenellaceae bacterium]
MEKQKKEKIKSDKIMGMERKTREICGKGTFEFTKGKNWNLKIIGNCGK